VKRRAILLGVAATLLPRIAVPQASARKVRVLVIHSVPITFGPYHGALKERLAVHGFVEGKNLVLDVPLFTNWGRESLRKDLPKHLAPVPDAIMAFTTRFADAAMAEAPKVPVVFAWVSDPVKAGIAKDYARPGVNATGVSNRFVEVAVKRLELLRELSPAIKRVAVVGPTYQPDGAAAMAALRAASPGLGLQLSEVSSSLSNQSQELRHAIRKGTDAVLPLYIFSTFAAVALGEDIAQLCVEHRIPVVFAESEMVDVGGLISYGTNLVDEVRRAADILARVLRGTKPQDIAIDQVSNFELAVNLRTAKQLKLRVPPAVLARASRVIE
jgi:putative ABC transport system substrate-binding protein